MLMEFQNMYKTLETEWSLGSINQQNHKRIADSVWLILYMRDNEYVQHPSCPLAPAWAVLKSGTQFSTLQCACINDPEWPENCIKCITYIIHTVHTVTFYVFIMH
jgi:hypothetical protein